MITTKQCEICLEGPPYGGCICNKSAAEMACARLAMYENAKLPVYPDYPDFCKDVAGVEWIPKTKYDELRRYASRVAVAVSLLNGIITQAARDAQKYADAAERSIGHG